MPPAAALTFPELPFSVDRVHERWVGARVRLQRRLQLPLSSRFAEFAVRETTVTKVELNTFPKIVPNIFLRIIHGDPFGLGHECRVSASLTSHVQNQLTHPVVFPR